MTTCAEPSCLTPAERAVYRLKLEGLTTREIASRLCIAYGTAKLHEERIRQKLGGTGAGQGWWIKRAHLEHDRGEGHRD